uniref:Uncharacterized protein LOC105117867 n=1 Tax=Rhizophora mucronata TaxID=61149 RepID=A0A2P2JCK3_RHIMU
MLVLPLHRLYSIHQIQLCLLHGMQQVQNIHIGTPKFLQKTCQQCGLILRLLKSGQNLEKDVEGCDFHTMMTKDHIFLGWN